MKDTPQVVFDKFSIKTQELLQSKDICTKVSEQLWTVCVSVNGCAKLSKVLPCRLSLLSYGLRPTCGPDCPGKVDVV